MRRLRAVGIWTSRVDDSRRLGRFEAGGRVQFEGYSGTIAVNVYASTRSSVRY